MLKEQELQTAVSTYIGSIDIPHFNLGAIQTREIEAFQKRETRISLRALALGLVLVPCAAIAYSVIPDSLKVSIVERLHTMGINAPVQVRSGKLITAEQAQHEATFAMILPAGLPGDAVLKSVTRSGLDEYIFEYMMPKGPVYFEIHKAKPNTYLAPIYVIGDPKSGKVTTLAARVWHVGDQDFIVATNALTPTQLTEVKLSMGAVAIPLPARVKAVLRRSDEPVP